MNPHSILFSKLWMLCSEGWYLKLSFEVKKNQTSDASEEFIFNAFYTFLISIDFEKGHNYVVVLKVQFSPYRMCVSIKKKSAQFDHESFVYEVRSLSPLACKLHWWYYWFFSTRVKCYSNIALLNNFNVLCPIYSFIFNSTIFVLLMYGSVLISNCRRSFVLRVFIAPMQCYSMF